VFGGQASPYRMSCVLLVIAVGALPAGCSSDVALDDSKTCATFVQAPSFDRAEYVKTRRPELAYRDADTIAQLVEQRCAALAGSAGKQEQLVGPVVDDAVLAHRAYTGD
jgi:hypothetical protein